MCRFLAYRANRSSSPTSSAPRRTRSCINRCTPSRRRRGRTATASASAGTASGRNPLPRNPSGLVRREPALAVRAGPLGPVRLYVQASTGTSTTRANCHPFAHGRHLFMHNGQVGGYARIKRRRGDDPGRSLRGPRRHDGFEAIFLAALANGLAERPVEAMARTLKSVRALMEEAAVEEPLRLHRVLHGRRIAHAYRWACDGRPRFYFRERDRNLLVVSEPIDGRAQDWREVPKGCCLVARRGSRLRSSVSMRR